MRRRLPSSALLLPALLLVSAPGLAQDSDGDTVNDGADAYPCDSSLSGALFAPAEDTHGMIQFEDEWPYQSDLDFNDAVISFNYVLRTNAAGRVLSLTATYNVLAVGGTYDHGLALHLPVAKAAVASATRTLAGGSPSALNNVHAADAEYVVDVVSDLRNLFGGQTGQINSVSGQGPLTAPAIQVDVTFAQPVTLDAAEAPFDLFIFKVVDPSYEIHTPDYPGTAGIDSALFGTGNDASGPGRWFVDDTGLPYALVIPQIAPYPAEATPVSALFPDIAAFAASGGASNADFYTATVNAAAAYSNPASPVFATVAPAPDLGCLPVGAPCANLRLQGNTTSGVYTVDPDGAGGLAPFEVYCEMGYDGGGWTLISNRRANTTNTEACGGNIRGFFTNGCGSVHSIGASNSYALDAAHRGAVVADANEMMILQYLNGAPDTDDAYIVQFFNPGTDLFRNHASVIDTQLAQVCTLDRTRCDSSSVYFKYTGDSWYHSSYCRASNWANNYSYRGNYGLCHDGWTGASSSYFTGNRVGYEETKLWAHPNGAAAYQERIFYR